MLKIETKASDWCTMWPDKWKNYDLSACCHKHDDDYENVKISRLRADIDLFVCIKKNSTLIMACIMFMGVRCLGWLCKHYVSPTDVS